MSPINEALAHHRAMAIRYRRFNISETKEWLVEPAMGPEAEILSPQWLRVEVKWLAEETARRH